MRSSLLGHVTGLGLFFAFSSRPEWMFGVYLILLAWFHWSEYLFASLFCAHSFSTKSFILNHSPAYIVATLVSWVEFFVLQWLLPSKFFTCSVDCWLFLFVPIFSLIGFRSWSFISYCGLFMCIIGETLRKLAIATAAESFNHVVEVSGSLIDWFSRSSLNCCIPRLIDWLAFVWIFLIEWRPAFSICFHTFTSTTDLLNWLFFHTYDLLNVLMLLFTGYGVSKMSGCFSGVQTEGTPTGHSWNLQFLPAPVIRTCVLEEWYHYFHPS